jgi:BMFP domain-containing protein YqiC
MPAPTQTRSTNGTSDEVAEQWNSRSHVSIFVRCLHLLDLDLRDDWPGITETTFSTRQSQQSLRQRIKAVEWSLYRLFELYSPRETQDVGLRLSEDIGY